MTLDEFDAVLSSENNTDKKYFIPMGSITTPFEHVTNYASGSEGVYVTTDSNFIYVVVPSSTTFDFASAGATEVV